MPVVPALGRPAVGLEGIGIHLLPRDPVAVGQDLAHPELGPEPPVDRFHEGRWERPGAATRVGGEGHPAHDLGAAGDDEVVVVGRHPCGGEVDGLLGRPALAVDGRGRHGLREPGRDPPVAGEVRALLTHLAHAPADDVVDALGVHARPLEQRGESETEEIRRVPIGQRATALAERRPHDVDDDGLSHVAASSDPLRESLELLVFGPFRLGGAGRSRFLATRHERLHRLARSGRVALIGDRAMVEDDGPVRQLGAPDGSAAPRRPARSRSG